MPEVPAFHPWGLSHQVALGAAALGMLTMVLMARTRWKGLAERVLGSVLLAFFPVSLLVHHQCGSLTAQTALPIQYCDVAAVAGGLALWKPRAFWCLLLYTFDGSYE